MVYTFYFIYNNVDDINDGVFLSEKKYQIDDLVNYFHNVKNKKGDLVPIIGEDKLAVTAALAYLLEDTNFMINAYSGTGKTVIMNAVFELLEGTGIPYTVLEQLSDTALWYDMETLNRSRFIAIPEAQKCPESIIEILKTWADDRPAERKRTDVTIQDVRTQTLYPKFVFMCKAVENTRGNLFLDAELERRYMITHTNPTVKQTEDVLKQKLSSVAKPDGDLQTMSDDDIKGLKDHIVNCIIQRDDEASVRIRNPCAPFLFDVIPTLFPIARSKVSYFLKIINAVARFFPDEIMRVERDGTEYGLVTPRHNWLATQIYIDTFVTECLQMPSHGIDVLHLIPDTEMDSFGMVSSDVAKLSMKELQQAARAAGLPFAQKNLNPLLTSLVMLGFLEMDDNDGKKRFFKSPLIREPSTKIKWPELLESTQTLMKETWPEVADDYISEHCTDVEVRNPFTKEVVQLGTRSQKTPSISNSNTKYESDPLDYGDWLSE